MGSKCRMPRLSYNPARTQPAQSSHLIHLLSSPLHQQRIQGFPRRSHPKRWYANSRDSDIHNPKTSNTGHLRGDQSYIKQITDPPSHLIAAIRNMSNCSAFLGKPRIKPSTQQRSPSHLYNGTNLVITAYPLYSTKYFNDQRVS